MLSIRRRASVLAALEATRAAQAEFWRSLSKLEKELRIELPSTVDFRDLDIDILSSPDKLRHLA